MAAKQRVLMLVMPGEGDMELIGQNGSTLQLSPVYYGNESMGPHMQIVEGHKDGNAFVIDKIISRARIKLRQMSDGTINVELKQGNVDA